jgi:hypothetical protein
MEITAAIVTSFRTRYPEFSDIGKWSDTVVTRALCEGDVETSGRGWGAYDDECHNFKQRGMFLFSAHWLVSTYGDTGDVANPDYVDYTARLNLSGKSVGDESVQYRITAIQATGDDWLSTTIYGTQFLRLRPRASMGARAV